jgi:Lrp/AsnC family leucine-responsive transcriptional regulator
VRLSTDLDATDIDLLRLLQQEGRSQIATLAEHVGLSSPAVAERLRKLEERGVIVGFTTQLDPRHLALDITAFIQIRVNSSENYPTFLAQVQACDEIMECHAITGDASHLVKIRTKNTATLEALLGEIQRWPGVIGTRTSLVLSTPKETLGLSLKHAADIIAENRSARESRRQQTQKEEAT